MSLLFPLSISIQRQGNRTHLEQSRFLWLKRLLRIVPAVLLLCGANGVDVLAQDWFQTTAPKEVWTAVLSSSDGNKLVAVGSQQSRVIYASTNRGMSWVLADAPSYSWGCAAGSYDGVNLVAASRGLGEMICKSIDSGFTWAAIDGSAGQWSSLASSADGRVLMAGPQAGFLLLSTNSGTTWESAAPFGYWISTYCSASGELMVGVYFTTDNETLVSISTDAGRGWRTLTNLPALPWTRFVASTNGSVMALAGREGQLYVSTDLGSTWVSNSLPNRVSDRDALTVTGDGNKFVTAANGTERGIFSSTDLGATWTAHVAPNNMGWWSVAASHDGMKMVAAGGGLIHVSPPPEFPVSSVVAWSSSPSGQNGIPDELGPVTTITASEYDSLAVRSDGTLALWNAGSSGITNPLPGTANVVGAALYDRLGLAVRSDGSVAWWGTSNKTNPIPSLTNITAVAAGMSDFYLALERNGKVHAWGVNNFRQTNVPPALSNVVAIAAGDYHSVAVKNDGTMAVWGGNLTFASAQTNAPAGLTNLVAVAAGSDFSLAVRRDGSVVGWPTKEQTVVTKIPLGLSNVVTVAAHSDNALALTRDGRIWQWGITRPYQVGIPHATAIACGGFHSLAIIGDGSPVVVRQPWDQTIYAGHSTSMSAGVVGAPPVTYQWQLNGTIVPGATNTFLDLPNARPGNAGAYSLIASNSLGITVSSNGVLTVIAVAPSISTQPTNQGVKMNSNVTFTVVVGVGPIPNTFQWQFNGTNISGATNASFTLSNVQSNQQGNYTVVIDNGYGSVTSSNAYLTVDTLDLPTALNTPGWIWTTGGDAGWFAQTNRSHDGFASAQSGLLPAGQSSNFRTSILQITITGPGTLKFWWMFERAMFDFSFSKVSFSISDGTNSTNQAFEQLDRSWTERTFLLGAGQQTLIWEYLRFQSPSAQCTARVDQVSFTPGGSAPSVAFISPNTYARAGSNASLVANAIGTPPLYYQWQLDGVNLPGSASRFLNINNAQVTNSGTYTVIITNGYGSVAGSTTLWVGQFGIGTGPGNLYFSNGFNLNLDGILTTNPVVIFGSTDLVNWLPVYTNPPTTGSIQFLDLMATNFPARFYRARE